MNGMFKGYVGFWTKKKKNLRQLVKFELGLYIR